MEKDIVETVFVIWNSETSNNTKYLGGLVMDTDRCVSCGVVVPEGRQVCWCCERNIVKIGSILQSYNATKDDVVKAYEFIEKGIKENEQNRKD